MPAQLALGADLARHARHLGSEAVELVDHRVDGVLELQDFALHIDGDLLGQIAERHRGRDLGDVAHLARQVRGELVDVVGQILPGAADAFDLGLAAELALGADLARHARHLGREGAELLDHGIHDLADAQKLAAQRAPLDLDRHGLGEVAARHRADHARHLGGRLDHVVDEFIDRADRRFPAAGRAAHTAALVDLAFLADHARQPLELERQLLVAFDDVVERGGDLSVDAVEPFRQTDREITATQGVKGAQQFTALELVLRDRRVHRPLSRTRFAPRRHSFAKH